MCGSKLPWFFTQPLRVRAHFFISCSGYTLYHYSPNRCRRILKPVLKKLRQCLHGERNLRAAGFFPPTLFDHSGPVDNTEPFIGERTSLPNYSGLTAEYFYFLNIFLRGGSGFFVKKYAYMLMLVVWGVSQNLDAQSAVPVEQPPDPSTRQLREVVSQVVVLEPHEAVDPEADGDPVFTYPEILRCNQELQNLEVPTGGRLVIPIDVKNDTQRLRLSISGGRGDADLYLKKEKVPELSSYDHRPCVEGNEEIILIENPGSGKWYVMLHAYQGFENVTFSVTCVASREDSPGVPLHSEQDIGLALYYELSGEDLSDQMRNAAITHQLLNEQGRDAFKKGQFDEALEIWKKWMESDPKNPRPVALVGDLYLRAGDLENAVLYYRKSLEIQPGQIALMSRLIKIMDQEANQPESALKLLNHYARLFPSSAGVALAQADWLVRRNEYEKAVEIIREIIRLDPENLNAMSLLHPLLQDRRARYENMRNMLRVGNMPGREINLGFAIKENDLLTRPESWVFMDFIYRMAGEAPSVEQRKLFETLLPRQKITVEDFRMGRMSAHWISSREEAWSEEGEFILSADASQKEAFLRLKRSDAMHGGFVEAEIADTEGFFWIYARRGQGNMIRFGFSEEGQLYLQVWMNDYLISNQMKIWSRLPGPAILRLELQGDGALGYINGKAAFSSPATIPEEMGLGWWGIAPWSAQFGLARVEVLKVSGGPLPARIGLISQSQLLNKQGVETIDLTIEKLNRVGKKFSTLAPEWYRQLENGKIVARDNTAKEEVRLISRYHRIRLLPLVIIHSPREVDLNQLAEMALEDRMDGFTLQMNRMPDPDWMDVAEAVTVQYGITMHLILLDELANKATFREVSGNVGIFSGPRTIKTLPLVNGSENQLPVFSESDPDSIVYFSEPPNTP